MKLKNFRTFSRIPLSPALLQNSDQKIPKKNYHSQSHYTNSTNFGSKDNRAIITLGRLKVRKSQKQCLFAIFPKTDSYPERLLLFRKFSVSDFLEELIDYTIICF